MRATLSLKRAPIVAMALMLGCVRHAGDTTVRGSADTTPTIWVNPTFSSQLATEDVAKVWAYLNSCAATKGDLPQSCEVRNRFVTIVKMPSANCHWQCGSICPEQDKCPFELKAGAWTLEYTLPAAPERQQRKACGKNWEYAFKDPMQYEVTTCEAECYQVSAVKALTETDPSCAIEVFGIVASRPHCVGEVPQWCKNKEGRPAAKDGVIR